MTYLADALGIRVLGDGMIVELFRLAAEFGELTTDESEEALVHSLNVPFVGEVFGGAGARVKFGRGELGI